MSKQVPQGDTPLIAFPCVYPIKVFVQSEPNIRQQVEYAFLSCQATILDIAQNASKGGNYLALTITIMASSEQQLQDIFATLKQLPALKMVL